MFERFDGTDKNPRPVQEDLLNVLEENWEQYNIFAIQMPTAAGKSAISRAIQLQFKETLYVTMSNALLKQYVKAYNEVVPVYGRKNYLSKNEYDSCHTSSYNLDLFDCAMNPMSYFIKTQDLLFQKPKVLVLDEADQHIGLLLLALSQKIRVTPSEGTRLKNSVISVIDLLEARIKKLSSSEDVEDQDKLVECENLYKIYKNNPNFYGTDIIKDDNKTYALITPLRLTEEFRKAMFGDMKLVLLSGTLFESDVRELVGKEEYFTYTCDSPIPPEKRLVYIDPTPLLRYTPFPAEDVAKKLNQVLLENPERPCLVHTTYSDALALKEFVDARIFTKEEKSDQIEAWQTSGDVILGAGMTTGYDFNDDKCRLNIIAKMNFASLLSNWVQKRRFVLKDGDKWYTEQTLKHLIQACGRSTRHPDDYSKTIILDKRIENMLYNNWESLPSYFKDAIIWGKPK